MFKAVLCILPRYEIRSIHTRLSRFFCTRDTIHRDTVSRDVVSRDVYLRGISSGKHLEMLYLNNLLNNLIQTILLSDWGDEPKKSKQRLTVKKYIFKM